MKSSRWILSMSVVMMLACATTPAQSGSSTPQTETVTPPAPAAPPPPPPPPQKSEELSPVVKELMKSIAGKENLPAGEVFKNVQVLKTLPAGRFLRIMEVAYSRALGVTCEHCHDETRWEADDKRPKKATREMIVMVRSINDDLLKKMEHLGSPTPMVNCTTCHRGAVKPATSMPGEKPR